MKSGEGEATESEVEGGDGMMVDKKTPTQLDLNLREFNPGTDFS